MITLDIQNSPLKPRIAVVGCLHGNEILGRLVLESVSQRSDEFENLLVVVANTDGYRANTRYIDQDLNRSFPGSADGNIEQKLADQLLTLVADADYLIDLHTTTSPNFQEAIITGPLSKPNELIVDAFEVNRLVIMEPRLLTKSLIGNVKNGISIEYGNDVLLRDNITDTVVSAILKLQSGIARKTPRQLEAYDVQGTIALESTTSETLENFVFSERLDGYPFIVDEKHYTDMRGFLLRNKRQITLTQ